MRLRTVILLSLSLACLALTGCSKPSPYLRDLKPSYNQDGTLDAETYRINKAWMKHLLEDLKACYKEAG